MTTKVTPFTEEILICEKDTNECKQLEGKVDIKKLIVPPTISSEVTNANEIVKKIKSVVNKGKKVTMCKKMPYIGKFLIQPGHYGIVQNNNNGKLNCVGSGRWGILNPYCKWKGVFSVTNTVVRVADLTIVNINNGYIGLADNNESPKVLGEGIHVRMSKVFVFLKQEKVDENYICHKTVHLVNVPRGKLAKISLNQKPYLFEEGMHAFVSNIFQYAGMKDESLDLIVYDTITRFRVHLGWVALCWDNQKPVFFTKPAVILRDSPNFKFVKTVDAKKKFYSLGSRKNITVNSGEIGITYKDGVLEVLEPGFHEINDPNWTFENFMSTRQRSIDLSRKVKGNYIEVETKDLVKVGLKATLFYKVVCCKKAICEIGDEKFVEDFLLETAIACLNSIVRSTTLTEVARSVDSPIHFRKDEEKECKKVEEPSAPVFFDRAHDEFLFKLHDDFLKRYGLSLVDLRIESFKIISNELSTAISRQAIVTAKVQTELANLEGQREVSTCRERENAEVQQIKNKILCDKVEAETRAKTSKLVLEAEAKAKNILIIAKAKAQVKEIQAKADFKYVEVMNKLPLGREIAYYR